MLCSDIGPRDAKIMIVGEAPGAEEEKSGLPFQGGAGTLLRQITANAGIDYNQCYITNVMNERPPGNDFSHFYEDRQRKVPKPRLELAWKELCSKIENMKPSVVILLGNEPLRAVTNKRGISDWRGCFIKYKGICCLPTYHPAAVLRNFEWKPIVEMDFRKAVQRKPKDWPEIVIRPTLGQALKCIHEARQSKRIAYDIETIYKTVRSLAIAYKIDGRTKAISIPFIKLSGSDCTTVSSNIIQLSTGTESASSYWSTEDEIVILDSLDQLLMSGVEVVGHNSICFDEPIIRKNLFLSIQNHYLDTMHAWHTIYTELPMGLDFLVSSLLDYPNYWSDKNTSVDNEEWTYNAQDSIVTLEASYKVEEELDEHGLKTFYRQHIHPLCFAVQNMQERGVTVDLVARAKLAEEVKLRMNQTQAKLNEAVSLQLKIPNSAVNPNSPKQMKELLYDKLRFPVARGRDDKVTTDEEALRKLSAMYPTEPILQLIIDYRKDAKLLGTYLETPVSEDGRMRSSFNVSGTGSGRLSSSQNIWKEGAALQNIPAGRGQGIANIRYIYTAANGFELMKGDLKQAEAMDVAEILKRLGYPHLWELYQDPRFDIHRWMGALIAGKPESEVSKMERGVGKVANHSGNYVAGPNVIVKTAQKWGVPGINYQEAKRILDIRMHAIPGLREWWDWVEKQLKSKRMLTNCLGRKRMFFGRIDNDTLREAVSWEPQSTVGDMTNIMLTRLERSLPEQCRAYVQDTYALPEEAYSILQCHDEVVVEYPIGMRGVVAKHMLAAANIPLWINRDKPLIIPLELSYGPNWGKTIEYKEVENEVESVVSKVQI